MIWERASVGWSDPFLPLLISKRETFGRSQSDLARHSSSTLRIVFRAHIFSLLHFPAFTFILLSSTLSCQTTLRIDALVFEVPTNLLSNIGNTVILSLVNSFESVIFVCNPICISYEVKLICQAVSFSRLVSR